MSSKVENDEVEANEDEFEDDEVESLDDTIVMSETEDSDGGGDTTVERIIADFERSYAHDAARKKEIRRRLEELAEKKSFEDTFAVDFDED